MTDPTFSFRPAGENTDITVAGMNLGPCPICRQPILPGAFIIEHQPDEFAHELCANP